ncbi:hypothetical protein GCM10022420_061850 [Streptomyces iranensis]
MPGDQTTQRSGPAGDQHRAVARAGQTQHDLAHVPGLAHEPQRRTRLGCRPHRDRQRLDLLQDPLPHLSEPVRVQIRHVERDLPRITDVSLAQLDEPSAVSQHPQRGVQQLAGQRVQHDVDLAELGREIRRTRRSDVRHAQLCHRGLLGRARRREHLGPGRHRQPDRRHADPARRRVDQHPIP